MGRGWRRRKDEGRAGLARQEDKRYDEKGDRKGGEREKEGRRGTGG